MRMINLRKAKSELSSVIREAQSDSVCVTVHGKPVVVLTGVAGQEIEDILLSWDRRFWREIDKRTAGALSRSVSLTDVAKELRLGQPHAKRARSSRGHN